MLDSVVKLHGIPKSMVTDREKVLTSLFWKELFILWNTTLLTSTTYHPQTDDQIERVNQCLEMFLRCSVHSTPRRWKAWLPLAEFWYNTSYHSSLGCTPFKALYGYEANVVSAPMIPTTEQRSVQQMFTDRQIHIELLKSNLKAAQNRIKVQADRQRTDREYQVGEQVMLRLQPYAQSSMVNRPFPKLSFKFFWTLCSARENWQSSIQT
jgi:hypothetical protein